jgi:hypothetical protein
LGYDFVVGVIGGLFRNLLLYSAFEIGIFLFFFPSSSLPVGEKDRGFTPKLQPLSAVRTTSMDDIKRNM